MRNAAARTVIPPANASATRWRKSRERGRAIIAGLLTSNDLESQSQQKGNLEGYVRSVLLVQLSVSDLI
ncbi:hypothetical protein GHK80_36790 [Sinorhizobium medicae]|nr:hypothetical protein [Sinorhizobium medicae]